MRALVIREPGRLDIEHLEPQPLGADKVRVRSVAFGICGTDLEILDGQISEHYVNYPVVPGHEWSGVVEEVGELVTHVKPGDRVISEGIIACGRCPSCRRGATNLCEHYGQLGFTHFGGAAEKVVAPGAGFHRIPDSLSHEAAVLVEPAATVLRGILRTSFKPGMTAAVVGPGTLGLLAVQMLKAFGAGGIILIGPQDDQLAFGAGFGATRLFNNRNESPAACVKEWTRGYGADLVVETSGSVEAVRTCFQICRPGGHILLKGVAGEDKQLTLPSDLIMLRDLTVHGVFSYTTQSWAEVLRLLEAGLLDFESLITHRYGLNDYRQAFESLRHKQGVTAKIVIVHQQDRAAAAPPDWRSPEAVLKYAVSRGMLGPDQPSEAEALGGGVSGEVWKIRAPNGAFVLKRALPRLKVDAEWYSDVRRIGREREAMQLAAKLLPEGQVPRVLDYDPDAHALAMSSAPEGSVPWKDRLMRGDFDAQIAGRAGRLLRMLHAASRELEETAKASMADLTYFRQLRIVPFHEALQAAHPAFADQIAILARELTEPGAEAGKKFCLVHGDFSPKNILIDPTGRPILLDFEVSHWGNPVYDLAFCIGHLVLKGIHLDQAREADATIRAFCEGYGPLPEGLLPHVRLMLLARIDGQSPVSYVTEEAVKQRIRSIALPLIREDSDDRPLPAIASMLEEARI